MATPTVKQLDAFYWAATSKSFSIAAQRLNLSISSLSKRINELEQCVDRTLFDRRAHRAVLTEDGERLLPAAVRVLESVASLESTLTNGTCLTGRLRFGVGELSAMTWLPRFVEALQRQHPQLSLEPYVDVGMVLERMVDVGELDFAVIAGRSSRMSILSQPVTEARFEWMGAKSLVGNKRTVTPALIESMVLITLPPSSGITSILEEWLLASGINHPRRITCNSWSAVAGMLSRGIGIGFLPTEWASAQNQSDLVLLASKPPLSPLPYAFQWRRGDTRPLINAMLTLIRQYADFAR